MADYELVRWQAKKSLHVLSNYIEIPATGQDTSWFNNWL